jgi:hypothetical protein
VGGWTRTTECLVHVTIGAFTDNGTWLEPDNSSRRPRARSGKQNFITRVGIKSGLWLWPIRRWFRSGACAIWRHLARHVPVQSAAILGVISSPYLGRANRLILGGRRRYCGFGGSQRR